MVIEDLVLLLLHLTSWREKVAPGCFVNRSWKGYDFGALDSLSEKSYIQGSRRARSVIITDEGVGRAMKLKGRVLEAFASGG